MSKSKRIIVMVVPTMCVSVLPACRDGRWMHDKYFEMVWAYKVVIQTCVLNFFETLIGKGNSCCNKMTQL